MEKPQPDPQTEIANAADGFRAAADYDETRDSVDQQYDDWQAVITNTRENPGDATKLREGFGTNNAKLITMKPSEQGFKAELEALSD